VAYQADERGPDPAPWAPSSSPSSAPTCRISPRGRLCGCSQSSAGRPRPRR